MKLPKKITNRSQEIFRDFLREIDIHLQVEMYPIKDLAAGCTYIVWRQQRATESLTASAAALPI